MKQFLRHCRFILLLCCLAQTGWSQNTRKIDSLYALERSTQNDTLKVQVLNSICQEYLISEPEVALEYANQALELAEKTAYHRGKAYAYRNIAMYHYNHSSFDESIIDHTKAFELFEHLGDKNGLLLEYNSLGLIYYRQGYYPLAIKNYHYALSILEETGDKAAMANAYASIAKIYGKDANYALALDYLESALKIELELKNQAELADNYNAIGTIYNQQKNYKMALNYFQKGLEAEELTKDSLTLAACYNNLGNVYLNLNTLDLSLDFQKKALVINLKMHSDAEVAATYNNMGAVYFKMRKLQDAINSHLHAVEIASHFDNQEILRDAYQGLAAIYAEQNNFAKAYQYLLLYNDAKAAVSLKENSKSISELTAKFDIERKEKENELLVKENQTKESEAKKQRLILYTVILGLVAVFILAIFIFRGYQEKKKTVAELAEKNEIILRQKEQGEKEKKRSDELLLNILPHETAEELKNYGKAAPRSYKLVTVLFTDFKGFTTIAEKVTPEELVFELDYCFRNFDEIMNRYGIEKIKTIGDAYMCAGGIPIRNRSNPVDVILAAFELIAFIENWKKEKAAAGKESWEIRVGIHTGPVVAGIVGSKKFAYDIWGDTVNTASRMESSGEPGKINISGDTYGYINSFYDCTFRGKITAKNKGEIEMYFVDRIKPRLSVNLEGKAPNDDFFKLLSTNLANRMNYKEAGQHIIKLMSEFLPENLTYHNIHHTLGVCSAVERIAKQEGIDSEEQIDLLKTAALFHDAGFIKKYDKNEEIGVEIAKEVLPQYGYSKKQIAMVARLIMATQIPQSPSDLLEQIMCDADLDYLGKNDFHEISDSLFQEMKTYNKLHTRKQWDEIQIRFLTQHTYFTNSSKQRRDKKKQEFIEEIKIRYKQDQYKD